MCATTAQKLYDKHWDVAKWSIIGWLSVTVVRCLGMEQQIVGDTE